MKNLDVLGKWAFIIGLIIAVIAAFIGNTISASTILLILFILGLIVGYLNITEKQIIKFLTATIALLLLGIGSISALSVVGSVSGYLNSILANVIAFVSAAALVVALKVIYETGKA
jgi:hypothetical protein